MVSWQISWFSIIPLPTSLMYIILDFSKITNLFWDKNAESVSELHFVFTKLLQEYHQQLMLLYFSLFQLQVLVFIKHVTFTKGSMSEKWLNQLFNNRRMKRKYPIPPIAFMDSSLPPPQKFLLNKQHSEYISSSKSPRLLSATQRSDYFPLLG